MIPTPTAQQKNWLDLLARAKHNLVAHPLVFMNTDAPFKVLLRYTCAQDLALVKELTTLTLYPYKGEAPTDQLGICRVLDDAIALVNKRVAEG